MKKLFFTLVLVFATIFALMAFNHIMMLTQAGLIDWTK